MNFLVSRASIIGIAAAFSLGMAGAASASGLFSGSVTGIFENPVLAGSLIAVDGSLTPFDNTATAVTTGFGTSHVTWGNSTTGAVPPFSQLIFLGDSFSNVAAGDTFHLGTIIFTNGTSDLDTLIFGAQLHMSTAGVTDDHISNLNIVTTANTGLSLARDADFIGFSDFLSTFNVYESRTASIELFGRIVGDPQLTLDSIQISAVTAGDGFIGNGVGDVPEPATWAMLLIGFGGLGAAMRRRRAGLATA